MCGIAGVYSRQLSERDRSRTVSAMLQAMESRGPDERSVVSSGPLSLGAVRLRIEDGFGGGQPSRLDSTLLAYNGELFGHREVADEHDLPRESSDTAVVHALLHRDPNALIGLDAQYSFAFFDPAQGLFLARDAHGVHPLFYTERQGVLYFASSLVAIGAVTSLQLSDEKVVSACAAWGLPSSQTIYRNVHQVPRSGRVTYKGEVLSEEVLSLDSQASTRPSPRRNLESDLRSAVERRIPTSLPYVCLSSGGIDSALIASFAADSYRRPSRLYGLAFDEPTLDERNRQNAVSSHLGIPNTTVIASTEELAANFVQAVRAIGEPIVRTAPIASYLLAKRIAEDGFRVVLSGEGADELFGGYEIFKLARFAMQWDGLPGEYLESFLDHMQTGPGESRSIHPVSLTHADLHGPFRLFQSHDRRWSGTLAKVRRLFAVRAGDWDFGRLVAELGMQIPEAVRDGHPLDWARYLEREIFLHSALLGQQSDRPFMASSVECRYPFLSPRVVDHALSTPWDDLISASWEEKLPIRDLARRTLPFEVANARKQPYAAPTETLLRSQRGREVFGVLLDEAGQSQNLGLSARGLERLTKRCFGKRRLSAADRAVAVFVASLAALQRPTTEAG